jgi:hypothetical protein
VKFKLPENAEVVGGARIPLKDGLTSKIEMELAMSATRQEYRSKATQRVRDRYSWDNDRSV